MNSRSIGIISALLALSFLMGRFTAPESIVKDKNNSSTQTLTNYADKLRNRDFEKTMDTTKKPDGTVVIHTVYKIADHLDVKAVTNLTKSAVQTTHTEIKTRSGGMASILIGAPLSFPPAPAYGVSGTIPILGPINAGLFVFFPPNTMIGVQAGWGF